jgi:hypothetical protein
MPTLPLNQHSAGCHCCRLQVPVGLWLHKCRKAMGKGELHPNLQADTEAGWGRSWWAGFGAPGS